MMRREIFIATKSAPYFDNFFVTVDPYRGLNIAIKRKNAKLVADVYEKGKGVRPLEVSTASDCDEGVALSALKLTDNDGYTVECKFQSAKTFENGGPYTDLLTSKKNPKKDDRLRNSGPLKCFTLFGTEYPLQPETAFYDWLYIQTLIKNSDLADFAAKHNVFSDVSFNPDRSINCQAEACAIFSGMKNAGVDPDMTFADFVDQVWRELLGN